MEQQQPWRRGTIQTQQPVTLRTRIASQYNMSQSFGKSVLSSFDVDAQDEAVEFLSQIIESPVTPPHETFKLVDAAIYSNDEDFRHLVDCARALRRASPRSRDGLDGCDVLTFIWQIWLLGELRHSNAETAPWAETDRLINIARGLAHDPEIRGPRIISAGHDDASAKKKSRRSSRLAKRQSKSHFWTNHINIADDHDSRRLNLTGCRISASYQSQGGTVCLHSRDSLFPAKRGHGCKLQQQRAGITPAAASFSDASCSPRQQTAHKSEVVKGKLSAQDSPYFTIPNGTSDSKRRPKAGTVASVPFPPLSSSHFGLVQEQLAHDPFWLLIAVTFLIKTSGQVAIPALYRVKERFPTAQQLADADNADELLDMIRHLGLANNRLALVQKYAKAFLECPPAPGVQYKVRKYDKRDAQPFYPGTQPLFADADGEHKKEGTQAMTAHQIDESATESWEIGHMTQGKYTLDSWRIFCRDEFLGRAKDWKGKGREPEFQPEWMRVMPHDKELRAYLRWMWMREGWEWDPDTGERTVLRPELLKAVNDRRIEYDHAGGLRVVDVAAGNVS